MEYWLAFFSHHVSYSVLLKWTLVTNGLFTDQQPRLIDWLTDRSMSRFQWSRCKATWNCWKDRRRKMFVKMSTAAAAVAAAAKRQGWCAQRPPSPTPSTIILTSPLPPTPVASWPRRPENQPMTSLSTTANSSARASATPRRSCRWSVPVSSPRWGRRLPRRMNVSLSEVSQVLSAPPPTLTWMYTVLAMRTVLPVSTPGIQPVNPFFRMYMSEEEPT